MSSTVKKIPYKTHGARLEELIQLKWETQVEAAEALGVAQGSISNWIKAEKLPDLFFDRYAERFREKGLNLLYAKNPLLPKVPPAEKPDPVADFLAALEGVKAQVEVLQGAAASLVNIPATGPGASVVR